MWACNCPHADRQSSKFITMHVGHAISAQGGNQVDNMPSHPSTVERLFDVQAATDLLMSLLDVQMDTDLQVPLRLSCLDWHVITDAANTSYGHAYFTSWYHGMAICNSW